MLINHTYTVDIFLIGAQRGAQSIHLNNKFNFAK